MSYASLILQVPRVGLEPTRQSPTAGFYVLVALVLACNNRYSLPN
jgi:hypothetical protein